MPRKATRRKATKPQDSFPPVFYPSAAARIYGGHEDPAVLQKESEERAARIARERPLKDKLNTAEADLNTGLDRLLEALRSPDFPAHVKGDILGDYPTNDAITVLTSHGEQTVNELCKLAQEGNQDAIRQVWESGSLMAMTIQGIAEMHPAWLMRVARSSRAMPALWHRKQVENTQLKTNAKCIKLGSKWTEDLEGKSSSEAENTRLAREWLERWDEIRESLNWRRMAVQLRDGSGPCWIRRNLDGTCEVMRGEVSDRVLLELCVHSGTVDGGGTDPTNGAFIFKEGEEAALFLESLKLPKLEKGETYDIPPDAPIVGKAAPASARRSVAALWAKNVIGPWLKWRYPNRSIDPPSDFAQAIEGLLKPRTS